MTECSESSLILFHSGKCNLHVVGGKKRVEADNIRRSLTHTVNADTVQSRSFEVPVAVSRSAVVKVVSMLRAQFS